MTARRWPMWLGLLFGLLAVLAGFATGTTNIEQWHLATRWTARVGFPLFILTYSASSLLRLVRGDLTKALVRDRRWWGLGFAACHTVHLGALVTFLILSGERRPLPVLLGGGLGYVLLYAMVFTSSDRAQRAMGRNWKRLHTVGIHWLWAIFAFSYAGRVAEGVEMPYAALALGIAIGALALRIAATLKARSRRTALA